MYQRIQKYIVWAMVNLNEKSIFKHTRIVQKKIEVIKNIIKMYYAPFFVTMQVRDFYVGLYKSSPRILQ